MHECLKDSLNVPTVKLGDIVGIDHVHSMARRLGIRSSLPNAIALVLGACTVTPLELACAYNTIAANGIHSEPYLIQSIRKPNAGPLGMKKTLYKAKAKR